jgi:dihydroflavonol-4-reductase
MSTEHRDSQPADRSTPKRNALVFGATGFIGRWLVKELLDQHIPTVAAVRTSASAAQLVTWLDDHHSPTELMRAVQVNLTTDHVGDTPADLEEITEVFSLAGAYRFGMTADEARAANVDTARRVVQFAAILPTAQRLVYLSGYRVGGQDPNSAPWSPDRVETDYKRLGAYEASKVESDAVVQATAKALGVPLTIVNPSTVIGHARTGETNQRIGLAATVIDLIQGRLPALIGGPSTFVPVVTVDYLARFMALLPTLPETNGQSYWVLDDATPPLPDLLRLLAAHHGVKSPRLRIPVGLLKRLPTSLTHADPETLSFLSSDRYPTEPANALATAHGLHHTDISTALHRWSEHLTASQRVDQADTNPLHQPEGGPNDRSRPWASSSETSRRIQT